MLIGAEEMLRQCEKACWEKRDSNVFLRLHDDVIESNSTKVID
jgi:hypothetical protein